MPITDLLQIATTWLLKGGTFLAALTIISYLFKWSIKFRLTGSTIFTFLLAGSCWAFAASYTPPFIVEGSVYAPIVYDNGYDLVVAQAKTDFPIEAIEPSLDQIAGNLKGGGRNGAMVHVRLRKIITSDTGVSQPLIIGEVIRDIKRQVTIPVNISNKEEEISNQVDISEQNIGLKSLNSTSDNLYSDKNDTEEITLNNEILQTPTELDSEDMDQNPK